MESYESILNRMRDKFKNETGFSVDDASDIGIRLKVLAGEIFSMMSNVEWLKREMFPQTASGEQLDKHAQERGIIRKAAVGSLGKLRFLVDTASDSDVSVPKGTVCSTTGINSVRFVTLQEAVIKAGDLYVEVEAQSEITGRKSNTGVGAVTIMVTQVQGIDGVTNTEAFTGGVDAETDEELRKRLIESYRNVSNGSNISFYKNFALKYDGVNSVNVVKLARGAGTIDIYVSGKGEQISADMLAQIQKDINEEREINIDIDVLNAELVSVNVYFSLEVEAGYDKATVQNKCKEAIKDYFLSLGVGDTVYLAGVSNVLYNVEGVKNYGIDSTNHTDVIIQKNQQAVCGTITITDM